MDITQYRPDSLLTSRDRAQTATAPISPIKALSNDQAGQQPQEAEPDGLNLFDTLLDTVNPLQNIPGVSTAYQAVTGDESSALAKMAGGFLFGGPVGLAAGAATSFLELLTGKSMFEHAQAFFGGEQGTDPVEHFTTVSIQDASPLTTPQGTSLSLEQYQAFASAKSAQNLGTGAQAQDVAWASNRWTDSALKSATGQYDFTQTLGDRRQQRADMSA